MKILKSSLIYKLISGFFVACRNSKIGQGIKIAFVHSLIYKTFFMENNKMIEYANHSKFLGAPSGNYRFSVDEEPTKENKYLAWLNNSFFMKMVISWKDCEHDDQYT